MDTVVIIQTIKYLLTVFAGIILGNGAVFMFNHMPASWFLDYGEKLPPDGGEGRMSDPDRLAGSVSDDPKPDIFGSSMADIRDPYIQRVKSTPWKYYFSMLFIAAGLYLVRDDWVYTVAVMFILWILLEMSVSDIKYRIVPDQLLILLAVSALGLIQYHTGWLGMLYGAALGLGVMGVTAILGKAMYRREAVGGGDIKLFAVLGLVLGTRGVLFVFLLSALLSGAHLAWLLARRKIKRKDTIPMVPYIAVAAAIYLIFVWQGPLGALIETLVI